MAYFASVTATPLYTVVVTNNSLYTYATSSATPIFSVHIEAATPLTI